MCIRRSPWRRASTLSLCLVLAACGGGGYEPAPGGSPVPPPPAGPQVPFTAGPDDLQHAAGLYPYAAASLLTLDLNYQPTPAKGPGWFLVNTSTCAPIWAIWLMKAWRCPVRVVTWAVIPICGSKR